VQIFTRNPKTNELEPVNSINGAVYVMEPIDTFELWSKIARFDAAGDMPADYTNVANVFASIIQFTNIPSNTFKLKARFHGMIQGANGVALSAPICQGVLLTINAPDLTTAVNRLTYVDLTGGGIANSYNTGVIMLSHSNSEITFEFDSDDPLIRIDAIGLYSGFTPTNILPAFLSLIGLAQ